MNTTILLIDDSRFLRTANERALTRAGYTVFGAADGEEALRLAQEIMPDLILLDMLLPKIGGEEVLRQLKTEPGTASIPVIVLSSLAQANETKLKSVGAIAYLEKSKLLTDVNSSSLLDAVKEALGGRAGGHRGFKVACENR